MLLLLLVLLRFSALQRAENSSMPQALRRAVQIGGFSALQRAENSSMSRNADLAYRRHVRFSALQRAENSSIWRSA